MSSIVGSVPSTDVRSRATTSEVSLFRLYTLRAAAHRHLNWRTAGWLQIESQVQEILRFPRND